MRNLSVKAKLMLLSGFQILSLLFVGITGYGGIGKVTERLTEATSVHFPAVRTMTLLDMMHDGLSAVVYRSLYEADHGSAESKAEVVRDAQEIAVNMKDYIAKIEALHSSPEVDAALVDVKASVNDYISSGQRIVNLASLGKGDTARAELAKFQSEFSKLEESLGKLGDLIESQANTSSTEGRADASGARTRSLIWILFSVAASLVAAVLLTSSLVRTLGSTSKALADNAETVRTASAQIAETSTELAQSTTEQAEALTQTAASLQEISAMISKSLESAKKSEEQSKNSKVKAETGKAAADRVSTSMSQIADSNRTILAQVREGNSDVAQVLVMIQDIGEKTKVINDIVFQTKLLSFNASVEAARAGEHGKGFSVVAEEVGKLAQVSGVAAKEISELLIRSSKRVEEILASTSAKIEVLIDEGTKRIESGVATSGECAQVLEEIVAETAQVAALAEDIAAASEEQTKGVGQINQALAQLDASNQLNTKNSEQASTYSAELAQQATSLRSSVTELETMVGGQKKAA